jgi:hypothetical protein
LEKLGFPWILSSEMSLFNGLLAIFGGNILWPILAFWAALTGAVERNTLVSHDACPMPSQVFCPFNTSSVVAESHALYHQARTRFWQENVADSDPKV